jgi:hypothetical protein
LKKLQKLRSCRTVVEAEKLYSAVEAEDIAGYKQLGLIDYRPNCLCLGCYRRCINNLACRCIINKHLAIAT